MAKQRRRYSRNNGHRKPNQRGYLKFKLECPTCGRMVKGHLKLTEYQGEFTCDCGAELHALFYRSFEWFPEAERGAS